MSQFWRMARTGLALLRKPLVVKTRPLHFQLEPSTGCNLRCVTCQVPGYPPERWKNMTLAQFRHIFDQIRPLRVALSGAGEPFLNPELLEIIRYANGHGAAVLTTTNFTIRADKAVEIIDSGLSLIKISLDAATAETYRKLRGRDFFDKIVRDIENLQRAKREKNSSTPFIRLQFVLQSESLGEVEQMVELAHRLKANSVYFQPLETLNIPERKDDLTRGVQFDELQRRLISARDRAKELGVGCNADILVRNMASYFRKYEKGIPTEPPCRVCLLPWFSLYITVDGDARPCCSFSEGPVATLGNLFSQTFEEIWNGEKYQKIRLLARKKSLSYPVCRNCTPNRLRDFARLTSVLPGFMRSCSSAIESE